MSLRLRDALNAAVSIQQQVEGQSIKRFREFPMYRSALERQLEIVGEALINVFDDLPRLQDAMDENRQMSGMRNRLAHAYFDLDQDIVWSTLVEDIPELIVVLRDLIDLGEEELESRYGA